MGTFEPRGLARGQLDMQCSRETRHDLVLHLEEIAAVGIKLIRPETRAGLGLDQLRVNPHPAARGLYAAFQQITNAEFPSNRVRIDRLALVREGRAARDHEAVWDARERGRQFG